MSPLELCRPHAEALRFSKGKVAQLPFATSAKPVRCIYSSHQRPRECRRVLRFLKYDEVWERRYNLLHQRRHYQRNSRIVRVHVQIRVYGFELRDCFISQSESDGDEGESGEDPRRYAHRRHRCKAEEEDQAARRCRDKR